MPQGFSFVSIILFLDLLFLSIQTEMNYTIQLPSIKIDYCNLEESLLLFHIEGIINPKPYCDIEFNLSLTEPYHTEANCIIFDDNNNRINCSIFYKTNQRKLKISRQFIKLNKYRIAFNLLDFPNDTININCYGLFMNKKKFINLILFFVLMIFI